MKLADLHRVVNLDKQQKRLEELLNKIITRHDIEIEVVAYGNCETFNAEHFRKFVLGEIQALNLELHNLGVELPGVATTEGARAITKGMDQ